MWLLNCKLAAGVEFRGVWLSFEVEGWAKG